MKKSVFQCAHALVLLSLLGLVGCYSTVEVGDGPTGEAESGVIVKQSKKDLPRCNRGHDGIVYYVSDSGKFFYCDGDKRKYKRLYLVGQDGSSCTVVDENGTATISCEDGTSASVSDGEDGQSCAATRDEAIGGVIISCPDVPDVVVYDGTVGAPGEDGQDGSSCSVIDNGDGTKTITCTDGTSVTVSDGADGTSCTVIDNGDGTKTIACNDGTSVTVRTVFPCTEQGIREAIAEGGGPHRFACNGPTTVTTQAEIVIDNDVILDGEGNLTIDGIDDHGVLVVAPDVTAELLGMTVSGGFAFQGGGILNEGTLSITDCIVEANRVHEQAPYAVGGGGIFNSGALTAMNSEVRDNRSFSFQGSGIHNTGTATLISSVVSGNGGHESPLYSTGTLTLIDTTVSENFASDDEGIHASGTVTLINSAVVNNAVYNGIAASGTLTLINSTVSGGSVAPFPAVALGGGTLTLINSTVRPHNLDRGSLFGTISSSGEMVVSNSLIVGSFDSAWETTCYGTGNVISGGGNIESPTNDCGLTDPTDLVNVTEAELNLGPLQDNGGPTETHALLPGSVAIDRIPEAMCVDADGLPLTTDQRGQPRPETGGTMCDVGAFEVQP